MKRAVYIAVMLLCCSGFYLHGQTNQITGLQYYFNTDPGQGNTGNGGMLSFSATDSLDQSFNFNLPPGIPQGVNYLYIRVLDDEGHWSQTDRSAFYIVDSAYLDRNLVAMQYYFDTDPGMGVAGNGGIIPITPGDSISPVFNLNVPGNLNPGVHYLYLRVQNQGGKWSLADRNALYVIDPGSLQSTVSALQYYFDTDPGIGVAGNGGIIPITPVDSISQVFNLNLPGDLTPGIHYLYMRTQNEDGQWGLTDRSAFYVNPDLALDPIVALEYFYDDDPGVGNATRINIPETDSVNAFYSLPAPCLPTGDHYLYVRALDTAGDWSLVAMDTVFVTDGIVASVIAHSDSIELCPGDSVELSFTAAAGVTYQWMRNGVDIAGAGSFSYFADTAGYYSVRSTCDDTSAVSDSVLIIFDTLITYYADLDGDGFGNPNDSLNACDIPLGYVRDSNDCNDNDSLINPNAVEICDGIDNNCDGEIDEGLYQTYVSSVTICNGDSVLIGAVYRFAAGLYIDTAVIPDACDSIAEVTVMVNPTDTTYLTMTTSNPSMDGQVDTTYLSNRYSCDSLIITTKIFVSGCTNDTVYMTSFSCDSTQAGIFVTSTPKGDGCDSIVYDTVFYDAGDFSVLPMMNTCMGDSMMIFGSWRYTTGVYYDTLANRNGCDSILAKELIVNPNYITTLSPMSICEGDSMMLFGMWTSSAGIYFDTVPTVHGCDSVLVKELFVNATDTTYLSSVTCIGAGAGTFTTILANQAGCDSLLIETITFDPGYLTSLSLREICQGDSVSIFGSYRSMSGSYYDTLSNTNGCDSVIEQQLTVRPVDTTYLTINTSDPGMHGQVDTTFLRNQYFCDSLIITTKVYVSTCTNDTVYTTSYTCDSTGAGLYTNVYLKGDGCDSIVYDTVYYDPGDQVTLPAMEICAGDSMLIFGEWRTAPGMYLDTLGNVNGCDSILVKQLNVKPTYSTTLPPMTVCEGDSMMIFGVWRTTAGTYCTTLTAANGCDSTVCKELIVLPNASAGTTVTILEGDSLFLAGAWQRLAGIYVDTLVAANGCDSVLSTTLVVNDTAACTSESLTTISDSSWWESTVEDKGRWGDWSGSPGLPAGSSYTLPAQVGQPYGGNRTSVSLIQGSLPIRAGNNVHYFRRSFHLAEATGVTARIRMFMDDDVELYINGHLMAREENIDPQNFKGDPHDILFRHTGTVSNGFMGHQMFDYALPAADPDTIFKDGINQVVLALRNLRNSNNEGGFSFRMDVATCGDTAFVMKKAMVFHGVEEEVFGVYPNPTVGEITIILPEINGGGSYKLMLFDLHGKLLQQHHRQPELGSKLLQLDLSNYANGIYLLQVEAGRKLHVVKVHKH